MLGLLYWWQLLQMAARLVTIEPALKWPIDRLPRCWELEICDKQQQEESFFYASRSASAAQMECHEKMWWGTNPDGVVIDPAEPEPNFCTNCKQRVMKVPLARQRSTHLPKKVIVLWRLLHTRWSNPGHWRETSSDDMDLEFWSQCQTLCATAGIKRPHEKAYCLHQATWHPQKSCSVAAGSGKRWGKLSWKACWAVRSWRRWDMANAHRRTEP